MKSAITSIVGAILTLVFIVPIFWLCCGVILFLSMMTGISYEAVNTYLFIYLQPFILLATSLAGIIFLMYKTMQKFSFRRLIFLIACVVSLVGQGIYVYYLYGEFAGMSAHDIGMKSYGLLREWGDILQMGYIGLNIFVFIFLFFGVFTFNLTPFYIFGKKSDEMSLGKKVYYILRPLAFILLFAVVSIYYEKEVRKGEYFSSKKERNEFISQIEKILPVNLDFVK